jgi:hypothetical protein
MSEHRNEADPDDLDHDKTPQALGLSDSHTSITQNTSLVDIKSKADQLCPNCGGLRDLIIQCMFCGDRIKDTETLSPYDRLQLDPKPLYHDNEIQAAKEKLLVTFHPLRASRLNAKWSLKQRALICRDAETLSRISCALLTYVYFLRSKRFVAGESLDWTHTKPSHNDLHQNMSLYLLKSAFEELHEYDGYQERERLYNQTIRVLLKDAMRLGNLLYRIDKDLSLLETIVPEIEAMQHIEFWLDAQRRKMRLKVDFDDVI